MRLATRSPLADELLDHLREEECLLREAAASLTELHAALRGGDPAAVSATRGRQDVLASAVADRAASRAAAAARLAESAGVPTSDLTLSALASALPEYAPELLAARDRLTAAAADVAEYQRRNANLIRHLRSYFRGVMAVLAAADAPTRYGPSGVYLAPATGGALQARG